MFYEVMPRLREINPELIDAIEQLYWWQYSNDSYSFSSMLYRLFQKADHGNLHRLRNGFPMQYHAWRLWKESLSQDQFFKIWLGPTYSLKRQNGKDDGPINIDREDQGTF